MLCLGMVMILFMRRQVTREAAPPAGFTLLLTASIRLGIGRLKLASALASGACVRSKDGAALKHLHTCPKWPFTASLRRDYAQGSTYTYCPE